MRRIINDDVQLVKVNPGTVLTPSVVGQVIQRAYSNKMYAKFYTDKIFIQVNFARNGDISVSSNIRSPVFINDLWKKNQNGWSIPLVKSFIYQWMQVSRRTLY